MKNMEDRGQGEPGMNLPAGAHATFLRRGPSDAFRPPITDWQVPMRGFWQDLRFSVRTLRHNPGFAAVALLTIALGIGANTAIFSVVHAVLLRPLPFPEPDRLVSLWESRLDRGWAQASFTRANFWDVQDRNRSFSGVAALEAGSANLTGSGFPERLRLGRVSASRPSASPWSRAAISARATRSPSPGVRS